MAEGTASNELALKDALAYFEDGKHRRNTLLFAVNGGAFAVAKLLVACAGARPQCRAD